MTAHASKTKLGILEPGMIFTQLRVTLLPQKPFDIDICQGASQRIERFGSGLLNSPGGPGFKGLMNGFLDADSPNCGKTFESADLRFE
jgi:hypothetical protein